MTIYGEAEITILIVTKPRTKNMFEKGGIIMRGLKLLLFAIMAVSFVCLFINATLSTLSQGNGVGMTI